MKPVPFAQYLARQQKMASRAPVGAAGLAATRPGDERQEKPRNSPLLRKSKRRPSSHGRSTAGRIDRPAGSFRGGARGARGSNRGRAEGLRETLDQRSQGSHEMGRGGG